MRKTREERESEDKQQFQEKVEKMMISPHLDPDMERTEEEKHRERIEVFYGHL